MLSEKAVAKFFMTAFLKVKSNLGISRAEKLENLLFLLDNDHTENQIMTTDNLSSNTEVIENSRKCKFRNCSR